MNVRRQLSPNAAHESSEALYAVATSDESPRSILEKIIWHKEREVTRMARSGYQEELERKVSERSPTLDFVGAINQSARQSTSAVGLIAEVKKASPSKGIIRERFNPGAIAKAYERGGAACLSVLTDQLFFQGSYSNLWEVRQQTRLPILCKEFIIAPEQVYMARAVGADALLLIAAVLCDTDLRLLSSLAHQLGMQVLVEVHTLAELDRILSLFTPDMIGINNRNLEDFSVDLNNTQKMMAARLDTLAERGISVISESGIRQPADVATVAAAGCAGILVGEALVAKADVESAVKALLQGSTRQKRKTPEFV